MDVFEKILRASQNNKAYASAIIVQSLANIGLFYVFVKYNETASSILLSASLSRLLFLLIAFISLGVFKYVRVNTYDKRILKKFLDFGIPMIGVWGISWVLSYCDRYIIAYFHDSYNVGLYDMSYKLAENSLNMLVSSFTLAVYPILIKLWKEKGKNAVELKTRGVIKYYFMLVIPGLVGLTLILDKLFINIIDKKYIPGRYVIIIVAVGMVFNGFNAIMNKIWQLKEKTKNIFNIMLVTVAINIILNILLIPSYGINAAAATTLFSYICSNVITYLMIRKEFKLEFDIKSIVKTMISTMVMSAYVIWFNNYVDTTLLLLIEVLVAGLIYAMMQILTNNVSINEVRRMKHGK
jgi:O-antigen/teichoic acid export membrane protein